MLKKPKTVIVKYPAESAKVRIGSVWMVQVEPIVSGTHVREVRIQRITEKTVTFCSLRYSQQTSTHPHHAVLFLEEIDEG